MQPRQPSTPFNPSLSLADSGKCTLWDISCCHSGGRVGLDLTVPSAKQVLSTRNSAQKSKHFIDSERDMLYGYHCIRLNYPSLILFMLC